MKSVGLVGLILAAIVAGWVQAIPTNTPKEVAAGPMQVLDLTGLGDGDYLLRISGDTIAVSPVQVLTVVNPNPPTPPGPNVLTDRAKAIKAAAELVQGDTERETTAKGIAALYRELARNVTSGKLAGENILTAVRMTTDMLLANRSVKQNWQPVRDVVSAEWTKVAQAGGRDADYAKLLVEAADGLDASSPSKEINPQLWAMILEIVKIILALLVK